jgi:hypothetical protein
MRALPHLIIPGIFLLSSCSGTSDSEDIRTSGLHATINITASEDDRSEVSVKLRVGDSHSNTYVALTNGDRLQATLNNSVIENIDIKDGSRYRGSFYSAGAGQENASYRVSFIRPNDTDAPNSIVTMPPTISGFSATPSSSFSRGTEVLTLSWNATSQQFQVPITFSGNCITDTTLYGVSSTGIYAVNPLSLSSNSTPEQNCEITITAKVSNTGTVDSAYQEGGVITATRISSLSLMSTP